MAEDTRPAGPRYRLSDLVRYMLRLGTTGFGGPVALVGYMHRDLVEARQWFTQDNYKEGLTLAQLAPGPLAAQLAIYLGYCHYGVVGASLAGLAFVLPSFLMVLALGWGYRHFGATVWIQAAFYTVGACIIGIIARSAQRLTVKTIGRDRLRWTIFAAVALTTALTERESLLLVVCGGLLTWALRADAANHGRRTAWIALCTVGSVLALGYVLTVAPRAGLTTGAALRPGSAAQPGSLWELFGYFAKAGAFVFGSGLAIVPYLLGGVVKQYHWLTNQQFLDAVAVAMITPGPVVITTGFIGYLVHGLPGACVAAAATFCPCYLVTITAAPWLRKHGAAPRVAAVVAGVTAAATGAIVGAVFVLGRRSVVDVPTALVAGASYAVLASGRKVPEPVLVTIAALIGLAIQPLTGR